MGRFGSLAAAAVPAVDAGARKAIRATTGHDQGIAGLQASTAGAGDGKTLPG